MSQVITKKWMALQTMLLAGLMMSVASAHHSTNGIYNEDEIVELAGTVVEWRFVNPHPTLILEVIAPDGSVQEWDVSYGGFRGHASAAPRLYG